MANRGLGFHQDAGTFDAWLTDLVDTLVAPANATGWSELQASGVQQRRILTHSDGGVILDIHRKQYGQWSGSATLGYYTVLEFFMGFASAWDNANKRPTAGADVSICAAPMKPTST